MRANLGPAKPSTLATARTAAALHAASSAAMVAAIATNSLAAVATVVGVGSAAASSFTCAGRTRVSTSSPSRDGERRWSGERRLSGEKNQGEINALIPDVDD